MTIQDAYQFLFGTALIWFGVLLLFMLIRSIIGPRITDRLLSINMIGTMISCCILILSSMLEEDYLVDIALLYAMISFVSVLILTRIYTPKHPGRGKYYEEESEEIRKENRPKDQMESRTVEGGGM